MYFLSIFRAFLAVRPGTGLCGVPPSPLFLSLTLFVYNLWMEEKRDRKRREREREREEEGGRSRPPSPFFPVVVHSDCCRYERTK